MDIATDAHLLPRKGGFLPSMIFGGDRSLSGNSQPSTSSAAAGVSSSSQVKKPQGFSKGFTRWLDWRAPGGGTAVEAAACAPPPPPPRPHSTPTPGPAYRRPLTDEEQQFLDAANRRLLSLGLPSGRVTALTPSCPTVVINASLGLKHPPEVVALGSYYFGVAQGVWAGDLTRMGGGVRGSVNMVLVLLCLNLAAKVEGTTYYQLPALLAAAYCRAPADLPKGLGLSLEVQLLDALRWRVYPLGFFGDA